MRHYRVLIFILIFLLIPVLTGCIGKMKSAPKYYHPHKYKEKIIKPPKSFSIRIKVEDWKVVYHRIIDDPEYKLGNVWYAGKFNYLDELVVEFKSKKYPDYYWLSKLPQRQYGVFLLKARLYNEPFGGELVEDTSPPKSIVVVLLIEGGRIKDNYIKNSFPWWGKFKFSRIDKNNKIIYLNNYHYPDLEWAAKFPLKNGRFTIQALLLE